jgi:2-iminoacetate synthase ThiH
VRELQDETAGFTAFVPWSYKRGNTPDGVQGAARGRRVALLSRARGVAPLLDNFDHIQASWFSEGKKTGQIALHFGADDFGGTLYEENVHLATGHVNKTTVAEIETLIREPAFTRPAHHALRDRAGRRGSEALERLSTRCRCSSRPARAAGRVSRPPRRRGAAPQLVMPK